MGMPISRGIVDQFTPGVISAQRNVCQGQPRILYGKKIFCDGLIRPCITPPGCKKAQNSLGARGLKIKGACGQARPHAH